jgi:hypothetical protein
MKLKRSFVSCKVMKRWLGVGTLFSLAALALSGVAAEMRGLSPTEIVLGMHTDPSGPSATYGVSGSNAFKMRFDGPTMRGAFMAARSS